jgi:hypothetical protein
MKVVQGGTETEMFVTDAEHCKGCIKRLTGTSVFTQHKNTDAFFNLIFLELNSPNVLL